jgi:hypothetical protein
VTTTISIEAVFFPGTIGLSAQSMTRFLFDAFLQDCLSDVQSLKALVVISVLISLVAIFPFLTRYLPNSIKESNYRGIVTSNSAVHIAA